MTRSPGAGGGPSGPPFDAWGLDAWAPLDAGVAAHHAGERGVVVEVHTDAGGEETFPVALLFRARDDLDMVDRAVLDACGARVLELGAGAGALAVPLVRAGHQVTALEILPAAVAVLEERGVPDVRRGGLERIGPHERFDTVVSLMNGAGLAGTLAGLPGFLAALARPLDPGGAILVDSTDPRGWGDPDDGRYPGELHMQLAFRGRRGAPFPILYVDADTLLGAAEEVGLRGAVILEAGEGRYLARLEAVGEP